MVELLGPQVASEWPASVETEKARAMRTKGLPSWQQKNFPLNAIPYLAATIRQAIEEDGGLNRADKAWASDFIVMHNIRGVKHSNPHVINAHNVGYFLDRFLRESSIPPHAPVFGDWWIDVGMQINSGEENCLQWSTAAHYRLLEQTLRISRRDAIRIASIRSSKCSRDHASHLTAVSGFRVDPGIQARGEFEATYAQAYTTDKAVVYNVEGGHHAKFLTTKEAMTKGHQSPTIAGLYDIYEQGIHFNSSQARYEVRVPWKAATKVLMEFDPAVIRRCLFSFERHVWW